MEGGTSAKKIKGAIKEKSIMKSNQKQKTVVKHDCPYP